MLARWRAELISLSVLLAAAAGLAYLFYGYHLDRSFITYRFAQNIAAGRGFAYNPGEPPFVHTAVSPFYAVALGFSAPLSGDLPGVGSSVSALGIATGSLLLFALTHRAGRGAALISAALYLFSPLLWVALGLDVSLWMTLALLSIWLYVQEWPVPSALSLALCILVHPEGALLAIILAANWVMSSRPFRIWGFGLFTAVLGAGWVWMISTFGSIGPTPGAAPSHFTPLPTDAAGPSALSGLAAVASLLFNFSALWIALPVVCLVGAIRLKEQRWALLLLGWAALDFLVLALLGVPIYAWSLAPLIPALSVLSALGITWLAARIKARNISWAVGTALALLVIGVCGDALLRLAAESPLDQRPADALHPAQVEPAYQQAGRWIRQNMPPEARVGTTQPGLLAYEARRAVIDFEGTLRLPEDTANILAPGDAFSWVAHHMPEILVLRASEVQSLNGYDLGADPWFASAYGEAARIATSRDVSDPLIIYRRQTDPPELGEVRAGFVEISGDLTLNHIATDFSLAPLASGRRGLISLEWVVGPGIEGERYITVRIQSLGGYLVALNSRRLDFTGWPANKLITSYHWVDLSPVVLPGAYNIDIGVSRGPAEPEWHTAAEAKLPYEDSVFLGAFSGARVQFGDLALVGYRLTQTAEGVEILLLWQALEAPRVDYRIRVEVRNSQGLVATHMEVEPYGGDYPTSIWSAGEQVPDTLRLDLSRLPPASYEVYIGIVAPDDTRLRTQDGQDAVLVGRVNVNPSRQDTEP